MARSRRYTAARTLTGSRGGGVPVSLDASKAYIPASPEPCPCPGPLRCLRVCEAELPMGAWADGLVIAHSEDGGLGRWAGLHCIRPHSEDRG